MAVKPVEYNHQSSSADLQAATQGASKSDLKDVTLTASNANEVKKDEDQGFTETLDKAQQAFLDDNVDTDTITYTPDEKKKTGVNAVDNATGKKTENGDLSKNSTTKAAVEGVSGGIAGLAFAAILATKIGKNATSANLDGFSQLVSSIAAGLAIATAISSAISFDSEKSERKNQTDNAATVNGIIDNYNSTLQDNLTAMGTESSKYTDLSDKTQETSLNNVQQLAALKIQYNDLMAQGNTKGAADIQAQMDALNEAAATDPNADAMQECKDNIETYTENVNESSGVNQASGTVASFLQTGKTMKIYADINALGLLLCAGVCALASAKCIPKIFVLGVPVDLPASIAGRIGWALAGIAFLGVAGIMSKTAKLESDAANAGDEMAAKVDTLNTSITDVTANTATVSTGYTTTDASVAAILQKAKEEAQKGVDQSKTKTEENNKPIPPVEPGVQGKQKTPETGDVAA